MRFVLGVEEDGSYKYEITICYYCLSPWVAAVLVFMPWELKAVFAASAVTIWIEEWLPLRPKLASH